ncbi:TPR end-of-group domain-containing protein [Leptothermofonsia sp. ETS-13]|uniref:TPR end-of-group domain-containing protein n=1 Tax=Leptothermofonsia sp. ETS-13 TaxID=3035696 RepID=UPI003BA386B1
MQRFEEAISAYAKATQLKPDFFLAWFGKARCHSLQGNVESALESFQQAVSLNPEKSREVARTDPSFDLLRNNNQFKQILEE